LPTQQDEQRQESTLLMENCYNVSVYLRYMIIWMTKFIVPHVNTIIYRGQIDKI